MMRLAMSALHTTSASGRTSATVGTSAAHATDDGTAGSLFRLPWSAADNAMTWLEPTRRCNITCDACFVQNDCQSDKSLEQIRHELEVMLRLRRCGTMLVAGGEPLVHPAIVDVVALVASMGARPVVVTNGVRLDGMLLRELKRAGARGFTLHVDSHQARPGWRGRTEAELNVLRDEFADLIHAERGLSCAFNVTVFPDTLAAVPDIVAWATRRPDRVHVLTLICVRMAHAGDPYDYFVGDRRIDFGQTPYVATERYEHLMATDILREIRRVLPDFEFGAYLGGTVRPDALKWAVGSHITTGAESFGCLGSRSFELVQLGSHLLTGRYLAFPHPRTNRSGRAALLLALLDRSVRGAAGRWLRALVRRPALVFRRLHVQSLSVVQPVDITASDEWDTCDGCPNRTFWNDMLVPACRADEYRRFGGPVRTVKRRDAGAPASAP
jgi:hypothetical protein